MEEVKIELRKLASNLELKAKEYELNDKSKALAIYEVVADIYNRIFELNTQN